MITLNQIENRQDDILDLVHHDLPLKSLNKAKEILEKASKEYNQWQRSIQEQNSKIIA